MSRPREGVPVLSDIEIANAAGAAPDHRGGAGPARDPEEHLVPYGHHKAKVDLGYLATLEDRPLGKLILMTALSPTPAGEGKTTTTVGLTDALHGLGHSSMACLREPSMGPVFGMKGGAAGGGYAQVVPMTDINLHFTGDFAAIAAANNLLAALIDNHVHHGNALDIDVRSVDLEAGRRPQRPGAARPRGRARRHRQRLPAPGRLRHRGRLRADGDLLPHRVLGRPQAPHRRHRDRLHPRQEAGDRPRPRGPRRDDGAAARRARAQPGADPRARSGVRARRAVRQHRARLQLGRRDPGGPAAGRLRRHRGRLRRRPRRGEVRRHQVPQVRAASGRRGRRGHGAGAQVPRRGRRTGPRRRRTSAPSRPAWRTCAGTCATSARSTASRASSRSTGSRPTPTRRSRGSSSWSPTRASAPSPPRTSSTAAPGPTDLAKGVLELIEEPSPHDVRLHLRRRPVADREGRDGRAPAVRRARGDVGREGAAPARADRGRRVRRAAGLRRQDAVLLLHRRHPARRTRPATTCTSARCGSPRARASWSLVCGDVMTMPGLPEAAGRPPRST